MKGELGSRRRLTQRRRKHDHSPGAAISEVDLRMMDRAIALAQAAADAGEVPVGAVVYRDDQVIAEAANNREATNDPAGHAELIAMRLAGEVLGTWRLSDCSLAVTLEPCPMCAGAMVNARLGRLVYGAVDAKAGAVTTLYRIASDERLNHRVVVIGGVCAAQCKRLLQGFFELRRSRKTDDS